MQLAFSGSGVDSEINSSLLFNALQEQLYGSTLEGEDYEDYEAGAYEEEEAADNTRLGSGPAASPLPRNSGIVWYFNGHGVLRQERRGSIREQQQQQQQCPHDRGRHWQRHHRHGQGQLLWDCRVPALAQSALLLCSGVNVNVILSKDSCRVAAAFLAALIGISVVGAGIALYKQFRGKRGSKPAQRVIEIGGLAQGAHATKSPSYSRSQSGPTLLSCV